MAGEEVDETRRPRRGPKPSIKILEQQKAKDIVRWSDSDEERVEDAIEAQLSIPNAPRKPLPRANKGNITATETGKEDILSKVLSALIELKNDNEELRACTTGLVEELEEVRTQLEETRAQLTETNDQLVTSKTQLENATMTMNNTMGTGSVFTTYPTHAVLATPTDPVSSTKSVSTINTLYCTIDTSRVEGNENEVEPGVIRSAIGKEMRELSDGEGWRCVAVNRDPRNLSRVRIVCRNEVELQQVKEAAHKTSVPGARVLRDQLYPVKVDNVNRTAVIDTEGNILLGAREAFEQEIDVQIAKMAWLSKKNQAKAYGSMVIYVTSNQDASRLLQGQYFHVAGESAYTRTFEPRERPLQCYKCQRMGHKAFSCTGSQVCAKCAEEGHHHSGCQATILKCVPCGGPHESFSKTCRVLFPSHYE